MVWIAQQPETDIVLKPEKYRPEGRDYVMQDGDVVEFRFNV